jgi:hypothetical protein
MQVASSRAVPRPRPGFTDRSLPQMREFPRSCSARTLAAGAVWLPEDNLDFAEPCRLSD